MIKMIEDSSHRKTLRTVTFSYDPANKNDEKLLDLVFQTISDNQPTCFNCEHYYRDVYICSYMASMCRIYGCIEEINNPHNDADGSKCKDYCRKKT